MQFGLKLLKYLETPKPVKLELNGDEKNRDVTHQ